MSGLRDLVHRPAPPPSRLPAWVLRLMRVGIVSDDPEVRRLQVFANMGGYVTAFNALVHLIIGVTHDFWGLMPLHIYNVAVIVLALLVHKLHRYGDHLAAIVLCCVIVFGHSFVVFALGWASDLQVYFLLTAFLLYLFGVRNWPTFAFFYVSAFIMLVVTMKFGKPLGFIIPADVAFRDFMSFQALVNTMLINGFGISYTLTSLSRAERDLARQVALSDALIDVMLPKSISSRLKSGEERQIADHVEAATVMFADLSGFTPAASKVSAAELVTYLDNLFCKFDERCESRGVDKIKTIGDSYMAVGGLSGDGRAGAEAVGRLALDLLACMAEQGPLGETTLRLRVGLHTGPVVAGVIGDVRVAYDVWSNTVNIAQRMEAFGEPDRIQVSAAFREAAGAAFGYEARGAMVIKGIGETETWFLRPSENATPF